MGDEKCSIVTFYLKDGSEIKSLHIGEGSSILPIDIIDTIDTINYKFGTKVEIYYMNPYNMNFDKQTKLHKTVGIFENFNYKQVFIKNENGCVEIINVLLIVSMREIK